MIDLISLDWLDIVKVKKISDIKDIQDEVNLPHIYYKYIWLLGQFIQHSLLYLQGVRVPDPPELKERFPDKNPAQLIDIQREIYGCKFNWETGSLIVCYKDDLFEITSEAKEIVAANVTSDLAACCGFDDRGFDFNRACNKAVEKIIENITSGETQPL
ncbi:MAG: hypothetical protein HWN65_21850 [Candidatus Helarchaeota archaeon]|nr:hypothetical protein [Candidatus Helarchaeota archaeon]